jgi:hypothetical protein
MSRNQGIALALFSISIYIIGGLSFFSGVVLIFMMKGHNLWGWGDGSSIGYLLVCVGAAFSIFGVLLMRIFRNRGFS